MSKYSGWYLLLIVIVALCCPALYVVGRLEAQEEARNDQ